ncbi:MAG: HAD hydrolase-like protein, partial [Solirubrobacteraceae bacterium]
MSNSSPSAREHDLDLHDAQRLTQRRHLGGSRRNASRLSAHPGNVDVHAASSARAQPVAVLFDIDRTLIDTGGAGAASWRLAFDELYGIPADIGQFTDAGMTDPDVGRKTFVAVLGREPSRRDFAHLLERRLFSLPQTVAEPERYRVLPGVQELLPRLLEARFLLGVVTGNLEAAAHIKLHRARLNRFFSFGGYGSDSSDRGEVTRLALKRAAWVYGADIALQEAIVVG